MKARASFAFGVLWLASAPVFGCGHCDEDKVAAVYDYDAISAALARGQQVAFFALESQLPAGAGSRRVIATALRSVAGVDPRSLRVATGAGSLSLSFDGKVTSTARIMDALNGIPALRAIRILDVGQAFSAR